MDCIQQQTNAISQIPQVAPLIYCFLRGKEQSCKIPKIPAQAKWVKEREWNAGSECYWPLDRMKMPTNTKRKCAQILFANGHKCWSCHVMFSQFHSCQVAAIWMQLFPSLLLQSHSVQWMCLFIAASKTQPFTCRLEASKTSPYSYHKIGMKLFHRHCHR